MRAVQLQPYDLRQNQRLPPITVVAYTLRIKGKDFFNSSAFSHAGHPYNSEPGSVWAESPYGMVTPPPCQCLISVSKGSCIFPCAWVPVQVSLADAAGDTLFYIYVLLQRLEIIEQTLDAMHTVPRESSIRSPSWWGASSESISSTASPDHISGSASIIGFPWYSGITCSR